MKWVAEGYPMVLHEVERTEPLRDESIRAYVARVEERAAQWRSLGPDSDGEGWYTSGFGSAMLEVHRRLPSTTVAPPAEEWIHVPAGKWKLGLTKAEARTYAEAVAKKNVDDFEKDPDPLHGMRLARGPERAFMPAPGGGPLEEFGHTGFPGEWCADVHAPYPGDQLTAHEARYADRRVLRACTVEVFPPSAVTRWSVHSPRERSASGFAGTCHRPSAAARCMTGAMSRRSWIVSLVVVAVVAVASLSACFVESDDRDVELEDVAQAEVVRSQQVLDLETYVLDHWCTSSDDEQCLELLTAHACSSGGGCPRFGWNFRGTIPGRINFHMTLGYLHKLREAAAVAPDEIPLYSVGLGMTVEDMLWHQVQMMLRIDTQFYATSAGTSDGTVAPRTPGQVSTSNVVDPTRFHSFVWVNGGGTAHAMTQADAGIWFLSVANNFWTANDVAQWTYYLRLAERAFRPYGIRDSDGGVRNNKRSYKCFDGLYCYWFHSFAIGEYTDPSSVLNQNLHAIRDAMVAYEQLGGWTSRPGVDPAFIAQLAEWARGGLFQLAYGTGNVVDPTAPPSLAELEVPAGDSGDNCLSYGYAAYDYDLGGTRRCIEEMNTCHYHYHSLSVLREIIGHIDTTFSADPYFVGAKFKLMYGRSSGDTRTCNNRSYIPPSKKVMNGVPLARLAHGSATTPFNIYCDGDPWNDADVHYDDDGNRIEAYTDADQWTHWSELRLWYEAAYVGCTF